MCVTTSSWRHLTHQPRRICVVPLSAIVCVCLCPSSRRRRGTGRAVDAVDSDGLLSTFRRPAGCSSTAQHAVGSSASTDTDGQFKHRRRRRRRARRAVDLLARRPTVRAACGAVRPYKTCCCQRVNSQQIQDNPKAAWTLTASLLGRQQIGGLGHCIARLQVQNGQEEGQQPKEGRQK